ncbi:MAG: alpha-ketoacid dehydrogenase subunit beta [Chloroflexi bacterium]|nr:alpha-ketoacid dehydrogenase subunit beta [Chloroflexota bacterium]MDK1044760.1 alpha-ketoacid dehydrogenase subunit beta [Anaerolineales bacterium]MCH8094738.1 alpha-ketoacid dehydrogenase subunit beta [Chloroflexota bacterium]MCH8339059.1 alpha-ketoacid dehydrogenase subunit beta [Chloroflexota bacterium]MCH8341930.1 alpha-ketoacid dehydrogenase subunit beta [Chloroflexota bacterium]
MAEITMREAISQALWEEMERDERVFIMGEEVGLWGGTYAVTRNFYDHFGAERVRDTPIAEGVIVGAANGAAMAGLRPVAELMTINFAFLAMDQIVNGSAKIRAMFGGQFTVPIVIRAVGGGGRQLGATHSQTPDVVFAHFPGMKVIAPGTPYDAKGLLKAAIRTDDPVLFIENATMYQSKGEVPDGDYVEPIGVSKVQREGSDVTIITYSKGLQLSLQAAEELSSEGIEAQIIDLRSLRPLDLGPAIESLKQTNRAVIVEEGWRSYGVGAEVAARLYEEAFDYIDSPLKRVAQVEVPLPYNRELEQMALPQIGDIVKAVREVL